LQSFIDQLGVAEHHTYFAVIIKLVNYPFDLIWGPHVVLVREKYYVSRAARNGLLEVFRGADVLFVYNNARGKRRPLGKPVQRRDGFILREVVADDHFTGRTSLGQVAFKLRRQILCPVVRAERY
jgi:hypothetical protein